MSDTPRTDAECFGVEIPGPGGAGTVTEYRVDSDFSRQLERELNAANDRIKRMAKVGFEMIENGSVSERMEREWDEALNDSGTES